MSKSKESRKKFDARMLERLERAREDFAHERGYIPYYQHDVGQLRAFVYSVVRAAMDGRQGDSIAFRLAAERAIDAAARRARKIPI